MFHVTGENSKVFSKSFCDSMKNGDNARIMSLLEGVDVVSLRDHHQKTLLHISAAFGNEEISNYLIESGCNVDAQDSLGYTPLILAINFDYPVVVKMLIDAGADVFLLNSRQISAFAFVVIFRHRRQTAFDIIFHSTGEDERVQTHTSLAENIKIRDVAERGPAKFDDQNNRNRILCFRPVYYRYPEVIEMTLLYTADPVQEDCRGNTALHALAVINNDNRELFQRLLDYGADINCKNTYKMTPLHVACAFGNVNYVKALVGKGADVNVTDEHNCTPLYASLMCHFEYYLTRKDRLPSLPDVEMKCSLNSSQIRTLYYREISMRYTTCKSQEMMWLLLDKGAIIDEFLVTQCSNMDLEKEERHHQLLHHVARIEAKTSLMPDYCREAIDKLPCCQTYYKNCRDELEAMKARLICSDVTFFDLLTENLTRIASFMREENFIENFESVDVYREFPMYCVCLKNRFESGIERINYLNKANAIIKYIMPFLDSEHLVTRKILSYIDEYDLRNIDYSKVKTQAAKQSKSFVQPGNPVLVKDSNDCNEYMPPQDKKKKYTQL